MATDHVRVYLVIDASASRTPAQWNALKGAVAQKPMVLSVRQAAARYNMPHNDVNLTRFSITPANRYLLGKFELDITDVDALQAVCDAQCAARSIVQTGYKNKFTALIQAELREAATDLGFGAIAGQLSISIVGFGARQTAIDAALTYINANTTIWNAPQ